MLDFKPFGDAVSARLKSMQRRKELYVVDVEGDELWQAYLDAFPPGTNSIYRERTQHDCSCCKHFVRQVGGVVEIVDGEVRSVWDVATGILTYDKVAKAMCDVVENAAISGIFRRAHSDYGQHVSHGQAPDGEVETWYHFNTKLTGKYYDRDADAKCGAARATYDVFKRGLLELSPEAIADVLDLINQNSLYRGEEHRAAVEGFQRLQDAVHPEDAVDVYAWYHVNSKFARFRNTAIGTLVVDLSSGVALEDAVRAFEAKVAPENYQRPKSLITPSMTKNAIKKIKELGLEDAIPRRLARLDDVNVRDVLFVDNEVAPQMSGWEADLLGAAQTNVVRDARGGVAIGGEEFISEVLPGASKVALHLDRGHMGNFAAITAPVNEDAPQLFKWPNNFAWSYDGDVADGIKERVQAAGGKVDCQLRVSLAWSNYDDLDLHCTTPDGRHIYYCHKMGILDVDMNAGGQHTRKPVENMAFTTLRDGTYKFKVHQYQKREDRDVGFTLQVAYEGGEENYSYPKLVRGSVASVDITVCDGVVVDVDPRDVSLDNSTREKWGISTNTPVAVDTIMLSPNHWGDDATGNKHLFFMLRGCECPDEVRGIYNEMLRPEMLEHRKVLEVLGNKSRCAIDKSGLAGVGFSSTRQDKVVVDVEKGGQATRYDVQF